MKINQHFTIVTTLLLSMVHGFAGETSVSAPVNPLSPEGIIKNWLLVGTFPNEKIENVKPDEVSRSGFNQDFLQSIGGEPAAIIKKDTVAVYKDAIGTEYKAKICTATAMEDGVLDFGKSFDAMDSKTAYAFSCLESDKDGPAYCWFGSDDSAKIWINGELVQNVWTPARALWPWENKFTVKLHKGLNFVLVKAENRRISLKIFDESHYAFGLLNLVNDIRIALQKKELSKDETTVSMSVDYLPADKALVSSVTVTCCDSKGGEILKQKETTGRLFNMSLPEKVEGVTKITASTIDVKGTPRVGETYVFKGDFNKKILEIANRLQAIAKRYNITDNPDNSANAPEYIKHNRGRVMQALKFLSVPELPKVDRVFRQMIDIEQMIGTLEQGKDPLYSSSIHRFFNAYQTKDGKTKAGYEYYVYLPKEFSSKNVKWPIILALHGAGERSDNIERVKRAGLLKEMEGLNASLNKEVFPGIVIAPQCPPDGNKWWEVDNLKSLLDEVSNILPIDKSRIYVTGMSLGGIGTWNMITEYPDYFAAAIPICGRGDPAKANRIKDLPIWVFHGEKDTMLPLKRSLDMVAALKACGSKVELTIYPDTGHDSWTATYSNLQIYEWLLKQKNSKQSLTIQ